ncbi:MAG TPA: hypothetical protein DCQ06_02790 [Myxococcales bacterium]|nr:hypothetical protein [Myxococcales bacterium]
MIEVARKERPRGVVVQLGGQTPLKLANALEKEGLKVVGTPVDAIDLAEDRGRFGQLLNRLGIRQPAAGTARTVEEALKVADRIGYPVLVRPSYVLGGTRMRIVYAPDELAAWLDMAAEVVQDNVVLIDQFLEDAFEYDVDAICDGKRVVIAGILEHVEEAGVHSGDSSAIFPAYKFKAGVRDEMQQITRQLGLKMGVKGLMNIQFAEKDGLLYVLEVNPRASRTVPFLAKATGLPLVQIATRVMVGDSLDECGLFEDPVAPHFFAKAPVFPFAKFPGADVLLGPEMRSTGEVMGIGRTPGEAYMKAMQGAGVHLPKSGTVFISVNSRDKVAVIPIARALHDLGFLLTGTRGTALALFDAGIPTQMVYKVNEGSPNAADLIRKGDIDLVINTPLGAESRFDEKEIRVAASDRGLPIITTLTAAEAAVESMRIEDNFERFALQDWSQ